MEAELQQILDEVSDLQKWRLAPECDIRLLDIGQEEDPPPCRTLPQICSIPRTLVISPGLGGTPVTPQLTEDLRRILFGGTFHVFNYEWRKSIFRFREPDSELSYALETDRGGARAVQMVVQARIIKHLLFLRQSSSDLHSLCAVGQRVQDLALAAALSDSLWLAGQEVSATVALVSKDYCITPHLDYKLDDFTEKLQLFTFNKRDHAKTFILDHIQRFKEEGSHGVILFLFSLICSRTVDRLKEDLDSSTSHLLHLRMGNFVCQQALLNLLLMGRACPNVSNGTVDCREDGRPLERPLQSIVSRPDVGYLHWSRQQMERGRLPLVGSMLKTPRFPVWLCSVNGSVSVAFSVKRSLLSDWRAELRFRLNYYNGQRSQTTTAILAVDTHSHHWEASSSDSDPERRLPSLEMTIRTKWAGAAIHWTNTQPFY